MNNNILEELNITELEERVEFGLCGGSGGEGGDSDKCSISVANCPDRPNN